MKSLIFVLAFAAVALAGPMPSKVVNDIPPKTLEAKEGLGEVKPEVLKEDAPSHIEKREAFLTYPYTPYRYGYYPYNRFGYYPQQQYYGNYPMQRLLSYVI